METRKLGNPCFTGENFRRNLALADRVRDLAEAKGCTPVQLASGGSSARTGMSFRSPARAAWPDWRRMWPRSA